MTPRKLIPLSTKHQPAPTVSITSAPIEGPTIRAKFSVEELRATAFIKSSLPTTSMLNACRAGRSKAFASPETNAARSK
ncbi:hypothetical protein D3C86_2168350 [compost metagenome]